MARRPELLPVIVLSLLAGVAQSAAPGTAAAPDPELLEFLGGNPPRPDKPATPDPVELLEQIDLPEPRQPPEKRGAGPSGEPRS